MGGALAYFSTKFLMKVARGRSVKPPLPLKGLNAYQYENSRLTVMMSSCQYLSIKCLHTSKKSPTTLGRRKTIYYQASVQTFTQLKKFGVGW